MMKESIAFLRQNADKLRERKIDECERIREEEERARLAIVKEKKRKKAREKKKAVVEVHRYRIKN